MQNGLTGKGLAGKNAPSAGPFAGTALYKGTAKETAAQFAALVSKDLAEARFLDGQNRGRIGRYEALLKEVKDAAAKAGRPLADSDINAALAAAIGAVVDGEGQRRVKRSCGKGAGGVE
ncbi:MAG: hypothetical protein MdMp014T_0471 [Treponematales bacterium]